MWEGWDGGFVGYFQDNLSCMIAVLHGPESLFHLGVIEHTDGMHDFQDAHAEKVEDPFE